MRDFTSGKTRNPDGRSGNRVTGQSEHLTEGVPPHIRYGLPPRPGRDSPQAAHRRAEAVGILAARRPILVLPVEVIDGDTVRVYLLVEETVRLAGINATELHGKEAAKAAKKNLEELLPRTPWAYSLRGERSIAG